MRVSVSVKMIRASAYLWSVSLHTYQSRRGIFRGGARLDEPRMLVGAVVDDELGDDAQAPPMRLAHEVPEVAERAVVRMDAREVGNVVAVIAQRERVERQQPHGSHAEVGDVVELLRQPGEVAHAVAREVVERLHMELVDDRVLVPVRIVAHELGRADERCGAGRGWRSSGFGSPQRLVWSD